MAADENKGLTQGTPKNDKPKSALAQQWDGFRSFLFNKDEKSVLGRTGMSWAKIGLFYLVFYSCLAAFFAAWLNIFFLTLDDNFPKQSGMTSLLKNNPGMGYRPQPDIESTLIHFDADSPSTYKAYVDNLDKFLEKYSKNSSNSKMCEFTEGNTTENRPCRFDSGALGSVCTSENNYGYADGKPCVLLKMNKIYGYVPEPYTNAADLPQEAKDRGIENGPNWSSNSIGITCEGQNPGDQQNMGKVDFYPKTGFNVNYFPYENQDGYLQPVVMAKFTNVKPGMLVMVWCKIWPKHITHHKNDKAGSVMFELMVDSKQSSDSQTEPSIKYNTSSTTR